MQVRTKVITHGIVAAGLMAAAVVTAAAGEPRQGLPASIRVASRLDGIQGGGLAGIQIQNLEASRAVTTLADFYHPSGEAAIRIVRPNLTPGGAGNIYLPSEPTLENGAYAADLAADGRIATLARLQWNSSGGTAIYSGVRPATDVAVPLAMKYADGQTSIVAIQNTQTGPRLPEVQAVGWLPLLWRTALARAAPPGRPWATPLVDSTEQAMTQVSIEFYRLGETTPLVTTSVSLEPGRSLVFDLGKHATFATLPEGTIGWMRVRADAPVAVLGMIDVETARMAVYAFEGVPVADAAAKLFAPLVRHDFFGTTRIAVVNPGTTPAEVMVTYIASGAANNPACSEGQAFVHGGGPVTLAPGASVIFDQGSPAPPAALPAGCLGSAVIEAAGGSVVATVVDADPSAQTAAAYSAIPEAAAGKRIALPLYRNRHTVDVLSTGIQAMNTGAEAAQVSLAIWDKYGDLISGNCGGDCKATIAPNASHTWYPPAMTSQESYAGTYGSAILSSDQPLAVVVNDNSANGSMDSALYTGINADP